MNSCLMELPESKCEDVVETDMELHSRNELYTYREVTTLTFKIVQHHDHKLNLQRGYLNTEHSHRRMLQKLTDYN